MTPTLTNFTFKGSSMSTTTTTTTTTSTTTKTTEKIEVTKWKDLADQLLCKGLSAREIKDALVTAYKDANWFVFIGDIRGYVYFRYDSGIDSHSALGLCGKNMVVMRYALLNHECNEVISGTLATKLIDTAVEENPGNALDTLNYIRANEAHYGLSHHFIITWTTLSYRWENWANMGCYAYNDQVFYFIKS